MPGAGAKRLRLTAAALLLAAAGVGTLLVNSPDVDSADKPEVVGVYLSRQFDDPGALAELDELGRLGVNLAINYALVVPPADDKAATAAFAAYLKRAQASGVGISYYLGHSLIGATPETYGSHVAALEKVLARLKAEPAIVSWYMHDERWPSVPSSSPYGYSLTLEQLEDVYRKVRAADSGRPQLCVWDKVRTQAEFSNEWKANHNAVSRPAWLKTEKSYEQMLTRLIGGTCDVAMIDIYPVGRPRKLALQIYARTVSERVSRMVRIAGDKPVYFVFQASSLAQSAPTVAAGSRFPTIAEMEAMLRAGHKAGADGAIAYSWYNLANPVRERDIEGRVEALANAKTVLKRLAAEGWP